MIAYFGYGSLVNRDTRPVQETANTARLRGWERHWAHRVDDDTHRRCTSLSAKPSQDTSAVIDGVVVLISPEDLPALDKRESGYFRQTVAIDALSLDASLPVEEVVIYQSYEENFLASDATYPILQSYVDCVMAGYHRLFGDEGLDAFMHTTSGWGGHLQDDRHAPIYPRAISLTAEQQSRYDALIGHHR